MYSEYLPIISKLIILSIISIYVMAFYITENTLVSILTRNSSIWGKLFELLIYLILVGPMLLFRFINIGISVFLVNVIKNIIGIRLSLYIINNKYYNYSYEIFRIATTVSAKKFPDTRSVKNSYLKHVVVISDDIYHETIYTFENNAMIKGYNIHMR